jgi:hypothetical protein
MAARKDVYEAQTATCVTMTNVRAVNRLLRVQTVPNVVLASQLEPLSLVPVTSTMDDRQGLVTQVNTCVPSVQLIAAVLKILVSTMTTVQYAITAESSGKTPIRE